MLIPALPVVNCFQIAQHYLRHDDDAEYDDAEYDDNDDSDDYASTM